MGKIIAEMAATIAVVPLCATYLPGIHCANVEFGVVTGLALAILYLLLRPIARALTGLIGCLTFGLTNILVDAGLVLLCLVKSDTVYRVELKKLTIHKDKLLQMVKIGVPAGIQSATFSISNVLIQSSVNSFGSIAMAGSTAGGNIEGFAWTPSPSPPSALQGRTTARRSSTASPRWCGTTCCW